jgi:hypothetical protein
VGSCCDCGLLFYVVNSSSCDGIVLFGVGDTVMI